MPQTLSKPGMQRCYQCNGRFGLIRRRFGMKQFCSMRCVQIYKINAERARIKVWMDFVARKQRERTSADMRTERRLLGFDMGDWSILLVGLGLVGLMVVLV